MKRIIFLICTLLTIQFCNSQNQQAVTDTSIEGKIQKLFLSMDNFFTDEKGKQTAQNEYYTSYESNTSFYGKKAIVKERKFEISFSLQINSSSLSGADNAKIIYDELKAILISTGRFTFKNETVEGSRTWVYASERNAKYNVPGYTLVLEYYNDARLPSAGLLLTRKKL
jgi:hypothetical protein